MVDFKKLWLKYYEDRINDAKIVSFSEAVALCDSIDDPVAYTSFILYCAYAITKNYATIPKPVAVAKELSETVHELGEVDKYNFVEAIGLIEIYSDAVTIVDDTTQAKLPDITFAPTVWFYEAIDFLSWFRKEDYPLISDWYEFFLFLPQSYRHSIGKCIYLSFSDYACAVKEGRLDLWYRWYKARDARRLGLDFKGSYLAQLRQMTEDELRDEYYCRHNWGWKLVKEEIQNRGVRLKYVEENFVSATVAR